MSARTASEPGVCRVGMAQMSVAPGEPRVNLERALAFVAEAAQGGCDVVVLPECLDVGWIDPTSEELAEPIPGPRSRVLADAACRHGIFVAGGLVERRASGLFNAAILVDPRGRTVLHHAKIHEVGDGVALYDVGGSLRVARTALGSIGLTICADHLEPSHALGTALARMGAQLSLSPCAWAVPPDHDERAEPYGREWVDAYSRLARRHRVATVGVSYVGRLRGGAWHDWTVIGRSLAMGSDGDVAARGPFGEAAEALVVADVPIAGAPA